MQPRDAVLTVVSPRPAETTRPEPRAPLLVLGAAGSGIRLATEIAIALGWADHSPAVRQLHDDLFATREWTWAHPPTAELVRACGDHALPELRALAARLQESAAGGRPFVLGDPRLAIVLPWWQSLLPANTRVVLSLRNPLAVARGLQRREGIAIRFGLAWWEHQWTLALAALHGHPVHVFAFESAVADASHALPFAAGLLGTAAAGRDAAPLVPALRAVVRPMTPVDTPTSRELDTYLTVAQRDLWTYLSILPTVVERLDVPSPLRAPSPGALSALMEHEPSPAGVVRPEPEPVVAVVSAPEAVANASSPEELAAFADRPPVVNAAHDALADELSRAEAGRRMAEADAAGLRLRLQVSAYEHANLRATLTRIEHARQAAIDHRGRWQARAIEAEARLAAAQVAHEQWQRERSALEATRTWRLAHGLALLWRRVRRQRRRGAR